MPRESTKDAGTSIRFPGPVWTHGCIQLGMHTLPLPPHLWARSCWQFWSFEYAENEKVSKQAKVIMPNILHITASQLTELEQTGVATGLFWVYFGPCGWELFHMEIRANYANQNSGNRVFCDRNHMTHAPKFAYRLWGEFHWGRND